MLTFSFKFLQTSSITKELIKYENEFNRKVFHDRKNFQNFHISWKASKSITWTFIGSLHKTIVKYVFHEMLWKKYFTVYPRVIRCYFDTNSLKQSGFCKTCYFKILVWERKYENKRKNHESQKKKIFTYCTLCVCLYMCMLYKSKNLFFKSILSSGRDNTWPATRDHVNSPQMRNETPLKLYRFFLHAGTGQIFLCLRSQIHQYF